MSSVLIVDDDTWQAEHFARQLQKDGHQVRLSQHAPQALLEIDVSKPDIILLDLGLPGVNGMAFLQEIRSHHDLADIPVIICTNLSVDHAELRPYGVVDLLHKDKLNHGSILTSVKKATL